MTYDNIVDRLISAEEIVQYCPEGMDVLPLCIGLADGYVADCFLAAVPEGEGRGRVIWKIKAYSSGARDTITASAESMTKMIYYGADADPELEIAYMNLYPIVREFAFSPNLTHAEKKTLKEFDRAWKGVVGKDIRKRMEDDFPDFFEWVREQEEM